MDSITLTTSNNIADKYKISKKTPDTLDKDSNSTVMQSSYNADISDDAKLSYSFLSRIESSAGDVSSSSYIEKYTAEYENIKKEIDSGTYGNDKEKYTALLDKTFKNALDNASNAIQEKLENISKSTTDSTKKLTPALMIKYQKQYSTATAMVWIYKAESKRIQEEIEYYKKRKNYQMVNSLKELSGTYKKVINNCSAISSSIQSYMGDAFATKDATTQNQQDCSNSN